MIDLIMLALVALAFAGAAGYVSFCSHIVAPAVPETDATR